MPTLEELQEKYHSKLYDEFLSQITIIELQYDASTIYRLFGIYLSNKLFDLTHNDYQPLPNNGKIELFVEDDEPVGAV